MHPPESLSLLEALPRAMAGRITLRVYDETGAERARQGSDDGLRLECGDDGPTVHGVEGRAWLQRSMGVDGWTALLSFDEASAAEFTPLLEQLLSLLVEKDLVERDMESINSSSLALLEEVSMVGDTLPRLATGRSEVDIAEMGLGALVVAASVHRALYVHYHDAVEQCEVAVQVGVDASGRHVGPLPYEGEAWLRADEESLIWKAIRGNGDAILEMVPSGSRLGAVGSPESLAEREIIAVPVQYGGEEKRVVLGVLLLMDKRANAYSDLDVLGSQETKLAVTIASMLGSVLGARKVAELGKELGMANEIQQTILPAEAPVLDGYDLAGRCSNSGAVGGDYFDFIPMGDGRTMVVVADVSGHNLASGMLMVGARSTLRALASRQHGIARVFDDLAGALYHDLTRTERFITMVAAAVTPGGREIELANAGHNDSMIYRAASGEVDRIPSDSTVLGFMAGPEHGVHEARLEPGDVLLLYTDGAVEATDATDEMLGEDKLAEILCDVAGGTADEILESVFGAVEAYAGRGPKDDDITAVVVKAREPGGGR